MSNSGNSIKGDPIREIAGSSITGSYAVLGGVLMRDAFLIVLNNNTNGDVYVSIDGVTDMMKLPSVSGRVFDVKTNDMYWIHGTQFYVRYDSVPGSPAGWFALEVAYA